MMANLMHSVRILSLYAFENTKFYVVLISFIIFPLFVVAAHFCEFVNIRTYSFLSRKPKLSPNKRGKTKIVIFFLSITLIAMLIGGSLSVFQPSRTDNIKPIKSIIPAPNFLLNDDGKLVKFNLKDVSLNEEHLRTLATFTSLEELILPNQSGLNIDLSRFPKLKKLHTPAYLLPDLSKLDLRELLVYDPNSWLETVNKNKIINLQLMGDCSTTGNLLQNFPRLIALGMNEKAARGIENRLPHLGNNLILTVLSGDSPRLDWLTIEHTKYIVKFEKPIDGATQNVHLIERLWMPADGLKPSVLKKALSLKWLLLKVDQPQTSVWYRELLEVVKTSLPQLKTLELKTGDDLKSIRSAYGKEKALAMLEELRANPTLLGKTPEERKTKQGES
jgi:hypothetical protein